MGKPAARIGDMHVCPMITVLVPHVGGPIIVGSPNVLTGKIPQARVGDMLVCVGPPDVIALGSTGVFVNGLPAARMGDITAHGGVIAIGLPTVLIGEILGGAGGGVGGPPGSGAAEAAAAAGTIALAFADVMAQVQALLDAARGGSPFIQPCFAPDSG